MHKGTKLPSVIIWQDKFQNPDMPKEQKTP